MDEATERREFGGALGLAGLPPEVEEIIVGLAGPRGAAALARTGREAGERARAFLAEPGRLLAGYGWPCARLEDCLGAALRAVYTDDAPALRRIVRSGLLGNIDRTFSPLSLSWIARPAVCISRNPRASAPDCEAGYTTLLVEAARALSPASIAVLAEAGARPWPYRETALAAAIDSLVDRVTVFVRRDMPTSFGRPYAWEVVARREGDIEATVAALLGRFGRSIGPVRATGNPLDDLLVAVDAGVLPRDVALERAYGVARLLFGAGYRPSGGSSSPPSVGFSMFGARPPVAADLPSSMLRAVYPALAEEVRQDPWMNDYGDDDDEYGEEHLREAWDESAVRARYDRALEDVLPSGLAVVPKGPQAVRTALDLLRGVLGEPLFLSRPTPRSRYPVFSDLLARPMPDTVLADAVARNDAALVGILLSSPGGRVAAAVWPTPEAVINGALLGALDAWLSASHAPPSPPFDALRALLRAVPRTRPLDPWDANPLTVARNALAAAATAATARGLGPPIGEAACEETPFYGLLEELLAAGYSPDERALATVGPYWLTDFAGPFVASRGGAPVRGLPESREGITYNPPSDELRERARTGLSERDLAAADLAQLDDPGTPAANAARNALECVLGLYERH
jgi:hypothetical protein